MKVKSIQLLPKLNLSAQWKFNFVFKRSIVPEVNKCLFTQPPNSIQIDFYVNPPSSKKREKINIVLFQFKSSL